MKLLLIGLLSVVALAACSEDEAATAKAAYTIVGPDKLAPVLFDNTSAVQLQVLDAAGVVTTKAVTYATSTGATGFEVSATGEITVDLSTAIAGTVIATVTTDADADATPPVVAGTEEVSYTPAVSALVLKSVAITPATDVSVAVGGTSSLVATATFGEGESAKTAIVTTTAVWTSAADAKVTVDAGVLTGVEADATGTAITAKFTSNGVAINGTKTVTVTAAGSVTLTSFEAVNSVADGTLLASSPVTLTITTVWSDSTTPAGVPADFTCVIASGTGVVLTGGTTCDKLFTGAAVGATPATAITVTHTATGNSVSNDTALIITPTF